MYVQNMIAMVTGASGGIGEAIARELTRRGAKIALVARSEEKLQKLSQELPNSLCIIADMTKPEDIIRMVEETKKHFGRIDILVNNAGRGYDAAVEDIDVEKLREVTDLDLIAPILAMQQVIPLMREQKSGAIVNISSGTALMILPHMGGYAALKLALAKISLTAREELKNDGIQVQVVYPFITATDFEKNTLKEKEYQWTGGGREIPPADSPEYIAEKIVDGIGKNDAEIFAHEWMKK